MRPLHKAEFHPKTLKLQTEREKIVQWDQFIGVSVPDRITLESREKDGREKEDGSWVPISVG